MGRPGMHSDAITFNIFLIFTGAAILATLALYARQALIVAYIVLGLAFGPWGLGLIADPAVIRQTSAIGIMFLLFLLGLNLHPQKLWKLLQEALVVTGVTSLLFALLGAQLFGRHRSHPAASRCPGLVCSDSHATVVLPAHRDQPGAMSRYALS